MNEIEKIIDEHYKNCRKLSCNPLSDGSKKELKEAIEQFVIKAREESFDSGVNAMAERIKSDLDNMIKKQEIELTQLKRGLK